MGVEDPSGQDGDGIPSWYDGNRVAKARVLLVGAGSLGEETALALYGRGFRRVLMVDPGTVGRDDIGHLALVGEEDVGGFRSEVSAKNMAASTSCPGFTYHVGRVRELEGWNFEVIVGCTGDTRTRLFVNGRARLYHLPYVDTAVDGKRGKIQAVLAAGPCAECGMNRFRTRGLNARPSFEQPAPRRRVDPQTAKVVASMASEEALRIACGRQDLCTKGVVYYDGADGSVRTIPLNVDPRCSNHEGERWKQTLKSLMQGTGRL